MNTYVVKGYIQINLLYLGTEQFHRSQYFGKKSRNISAGVSTRNRFLELEHKICWYLSLSTTHPVATSSHQWTSTSSQLLCRILSFDVLSCRKTMRSNLFVRCFKTRCFVLMRALSCFLRLWAGHLIISSLSGLGQQWFLWTWGSDICKTWDNAKQINQMEAAKSWKLCFWECHYSQFLWTVLSS